MAGRANPPEGMPQGGGDDEFGSTVFDESFVRRARLQEYSAQERLADHEHPVRPLPASARAGGSSLKQGIVLFALVVLAFGAALYMGVTGPYEQPAAQRSQPLRATIVPLVPQGTVPGGTPDALFAAGPAADFGTGAAGVTLPRSTATRDFSDSQVLAALTLGKEYVVASAIDARVVTGEATAPVRNLLVDDQRARFDRSLRAASGADSGASAGPAAGPAAPPATAWLVRLDPEHAALADPGVRVRGTMTVSQQGRDVLKVTTDHVFVYAVRSADAADAAGETRESALFTVRRQVRLQIGREDLPRQRLSVEHVVLQAGPLPCSAVSADRLRPVLAGERVAQDEATGIDPYADRPSGSPVCGTLAEAAQPRPAD
ncbi:MULTISPECIES: SCO2583 family membrane protein [Streptomyces]|uniref:SCO2583 family membrane protein n=1 Tax=Streptomyces TaxID=1883 RepID=UPI0022492895|nr:hypothetical protein [Streptomyces sp. JHD 1]MCX2969895.1 hypothetical protein [Streptomyces sp. JHD 1]